MEATPRPWQLDGDIEQRRGGFPNYVVMGPGDPQSAPWLVAEGLSKADAEFIVKAANTHDRLVAALEMAETWFMTEGTCPPDATACDQCKLERQIRAALALAREEVEA